MLPVIAEDSFRIHDVLSILVTGVSHGLHPLLHHHLVVLHVDVQTHGSGSGCGGSTGSSIIWPATKQLIYFDFHFQHLPWRRDDDELLRSREI